MTTDTNVETSTELRHEFSIQISDINLSVEVDKDKNIDLDELAEIISGFITIDLNGIWRYLHRHGIEVNEMELNHDCYDAEVEHTCTEEV